VNFFYQAIDQDVEFWGSFLTFLLKCILPQVNKEKDGSRSTY
jgi:hypothetical protein